MTQSISKKSIVGMLIAAVMCVALLGVVAPQKAYAEQGWYTNSTGVWYEYDNNGNYYKNGWKKIDNHWYYFQSDGYAKKGWYSDGKYWYFLVDFTSTPFMMQGNVCEIDGKNYCFDSAGHMVTGWYKFWDTGGTDKPSVCWVYADKSGVLAENCWRKLDGKWYHFSMPNDAKYTYASVDGWKKISGGWYYFDKSTAMATGWQKDDGKWYFLDKNSGVMAYNEWREGYWLNGDGTWTYPHKGSWHKDSKGWWFGDESGWYAKNSTQWIDGKAYNFNNGGYCTNP